MFPIVLSHDVFVLFDKSDTASPREIEQVSFIHRMERRVLLQEIGDTIADGGCVHRAPQ